MLNSLKLASILPWRTPNPLLIIIVIDYGNWIPLADFFVRTYSSYIRHL
jgi:hypothetical protein